MDKFENLKNELWMLTFDFGGIITKMQGRFYVEDEEQTTRLLEVYDEIFEVVKTNGSLTIDQFVCIFMVYAHIAGHATRESWIMDLTIKIEKKVESLRGENKYKIWKFAQGDKA